MIAATGDIASARAAQAATTVDTHRLHGRLGPGPVRPRHEPQPPDGNRHRCNAVFQHADGEASGVPARSRPQRQLDRNADEPGQLELQGRRRGGRSSGARVWGDRRCLRMRRAPARSTSRSTPSRRNAPAQCSSPAIRCSSGSATGSPCSPPDIARCRLSRGPREFAVAGGLLELRDEHPAGCIAKPGSMRSHPQGRETLRLAGDPAHEVRAGDQSEGRTDPGPQRFRSRCCSAPTK